MEERDISAHFDRALSLIVQNKTLEALFFLDKIIGSISSPEVLSAYGLCIALERGQVKEAINMCINAIKDDPENPFHYLNLGKVYLKDNKKAIAIDIFRKGLRNSVPDENSREINRVLADLGTRKRPILPFLPRTNFINKYLGIILGRFLRLR